MKGLTAPKVAQAMDISLGQVYVAKHRVSAAFRKALEEARARAE